jgi:CubicO group peptidase (beta-lactamase class C family)
MYDLGIDVLGVLLARASGQPLETLLRSRILDPLGMHDTSFSVSPDKIERFATSYMPNPETGAIELYDDARDSQWSRPPAFPSASGGLVSTVDDYLAFGQMLLKSGVIGDQRILSRPAVEIMVADHVTPAQKATSPFFPGFWDTSGWGLGLSVVTARDAIGPSPGSFGWDGGVGTSWRSDPAEDMVAILMTQIAYSTEVWLDFWTLAYSAIDD